MNRTLATLFPPQKSERKILSLFVKKINIWNVFRDDKKFMVRISRWAYRKFCKMASEHPENASEIIRRVKAAGSCGMISIGADMYVHGWIRILRTREVWSVKH